MTNELQATKPDESMLSEINFKHAYKMAELMSTTQLIPKAYHNKPADILVAFEFGRSLGLGPLQAVQNIAVVNGRPCLWGDAMLAVCQGNPDFHYIKETPMTNTNGEFIGYECCVKRKSYPEETTRIFTVEDAKKAGLWGKNVWASYPQRMTQMRARAFALRDCFASSLMGVASAEEVNDYPSDSKQSKPAASDALKDLLTKKKSAPEEIKTIVLATAKQHEEIEMLISVKKFAKNRVDGACKHYGVSDINALDFDQAIDFITKLNKEPDFQNN